MHWRAQRWAPSLNPFQCASETFSPGGRAPRGAGPCDGHRGQTSEESFMSRTTLFAATVVATAISAQPGTGQTWTGAVNTDWNTAGNWNPATVPNSATAAVSFGDVGVGTVNISSSVQAQSLAFSSTSGFYTLTSNPGVTLRGVTAITVSAVGAP